MDDNKQDSGQPVVNEQHAEALDLWLMAQAAITERDAVLRSWLMGMATWPQVETQIETAFDVYRRARDKMSALPPGERTAAIEACRRGVLMLAQQGQPTGLELVVMHLVVPWGKPPDDKPESFSVEVAYNASRPGWDVVVGVPMVAVRGRPAQRRPITAPVWIDGARDQPAVQNSPIKLVKLGPGVWSLSCMIQAQGLAHMYVTLRDVPNPAPWERSVVLDTSAWR